MASNVKKQKVDNDAGLSNADASEPATNVEATQARILELTREHKNLTQVVMDSDPIISKIPKLELLNILNTLTKSVIVLSFGKCLFIYWNMLIIFS